MVLDAARAAHIPGVATHGSGFLSDPSEVLSKMTSTGVQLTSVERVTGMQATHRSVMRVGFPESLGPLGLVEVHSSKLQVQRTDVTSSGSRYVVTKGLTEELSGLSTLRGHCSPVAKLPTLWPGAPESAVSLCWAYPVEGVADLRRQNQTQFLAMSAQAELQFAAYGGYLLLDASDCVVAMQAVSGETEYMRLNFGAWRKWRPEFTEQLRAAGRFQPVTLPFMIAAGAREFCWINPDEELTAGPEGWTPCQEGAFLYLFANGDAKWFPVNKPTRDDATPTHTLQKTGRLVRITEALFSS